MSRGKAMCPVFIWAWEWTGSVYHSMYRSAPSGFGRLAAASATAAAEPPTGRLIRPYRGVGASIRVLAEIRGCGYKNVSES